jgi:aerobic-type carbon monoxide dehydrogenase small subunit (CoxS/CutS family)
VGNRSAGIVMTDSVGVFLRTVVNGSTREAAAVPDRSLLSWLREELGLTGAKPGCGEGVCGACTVLVDRKPVHACRTLLSEVAGRAVLTVEGLAIDGRLHPVQQAFLETEAMQCGYCTAGMIMTTVALLDQEAQPDEARVRDVLGGNACRCCTYPRILRAVGRAGELARGGRAEGILAAAAGVPSLPDSPRPRRPWDMTGSASRDYFAVLPDGLVVVKESDRAAQSGAWTTSPGAWLHVGSDGVVTAFTGKVDVGQDNRTALSMRVAEELRVPLGSVRLVMGDTDVCPYDVGTFGSRSMPDAGEQLRRLAAGAREIMTELAASVWGSERSGLTAENGRVRQREGLQSATYGELVRGLRLVKNAPADAPVTAGPDEELVGKPAARVGALDIVTGTRLYVTDLARPGMLHGRVLRSPAHGATMRSVDVSGAKAIPGVTVVHEGSFVGVAAPDTAVASRALKAIEVAWDRESGPAEAELADYLRAHPVDEEGWEGAFHQDSGDVDAALAAAPVRLSATYTTAYIAHAPLETHAALAEWDQEGRLTVWTGTQVPFGVRRGLAQELGVPEASVRVIVPATGARQGALEPGRGVRRRLPPPRRGDRHPQRRRSGRPHQRLGDAQHQLGHVRPGRPLRGPEPAPRLPARRLAARPGLLPVPGGSCQPLCARVPHG